MSSLGYSFGPTRTSKDKRKATRKAVGSGAWIRLDGGFALISCRVVDLSHTGVRVVVGGNKSVSGTFTLLMTRDAKGCRARVKWQRGSEIGAEFV